MKPLTEKQKARIELSRQIILDNFGSEEEFLNTDEEFRNKFIAKEYLKRTHIGKKILISIACITVVMLIFSIILTVL